MTTRAPIVWGAIVVAAGQSERFGESDKLMSNLQDSPVICWSLRVMLSDLRIRQVVLVTSQENIDAMQAIVDSGFTCRDVSTCLGGATRSLSVRSGLEALRSEISHVAIHDGARPLVSSDLVSRVLDAAEETGASAPAIRVTSSIGVEGRSGDVLVGTVDRSRLRELQTPQAAMRSELIDALDRFSGETDESAALFRAGHSVSLVAGERSNIKITVPEDLLIAAALAGSGYGGHRCE